LWYGLRSSSFTGRNSGLLSFFDMMSPSYELIQFPGARIASARSLRKTAA
jgi:hypothetical protein